MAYKIFSKLLEDQTCYISIIPDSKNSLLADFEIIDNTNLNKNSFGKTLIIGGADGYLGAVIIAGKSALRSGSRYVDVFTTESNHGLISLNQPELITSYDFNTLNNKLSKYNNLLLGPGLSDSEWSRKIFSETKKMLSVSDIKKNIVIDAGYLNFLAKESFRNEYWILTPHAGEAAKLLNTSISDIENNRIDSAIRIQKHYGGIIILKGHRTIIQTESDTFICSHGNSAMGTAGMGDCLGGIILSLISLVDIKDYKNAVLYATAIHSLAADNVSIEKGKIGLLASDVIVEVNRIFNSIEKH